jgi:hypothetical protein
MGVHGTTLSWTEIVGRCDSRDRLTGCSRRCATADADADQDVLRCDSTASVHSNGNNTSDAAVSR